MKKAIIRHLVDSETLGIMASLDLKSAYDLVRRQKLHEITAEAPPADIRSAINFALQPIEIKTQGDQSRMTGTVARGVRRGAPLSPTPFNLCMDTLPKPLHTTQAAVTPLTKGSPCTASQHWNITMFAGDVKIQSRNPKILQQLLITVTQRLLTTS